MRWFFVAVLFAASAHAWEPSTHAGLTERAALAAQLHQRLASELGRPLGLYESLKLASAHSEEDHELGRRLAKLDPEGGYAPDLGKQTALGWLIAGSVLEGIPAARTRNHFFDPAGGAGLAEDTSAFRTRVAAAASGIGTLRGIFTGANFDGSGRPSLSWMTAPREVNDWGLARFLDERERAVTAAAPAEREDALVRTLLAAGSLVHLIEDAGDPALVHGDFRVALADDGAPFERWVAARYGRLALPSPLANGAAHAHLLELIHDPAGQGLADRTARRFFSPGSLPAIGAPIPSALAPHGSPSGYVGSAEVAHLAAYRKEAAGVVYWLDERCHKDYAEALLPEVGRAAVSAIDLLFRGRLELSAAEDKLQVRVAEVPLGRGRVSLFADDDKGNRRQIAAADVSGAAVGDLLLSAPAGEKRLAALFSGLDAAGEPIVIAREITLP